MTILDTTGYSTVPLTNDALFLFCPSIYWLTKALFVFIILIVIDITIIIVSYSDDWLLSYWLFW